MHTLIKAGYHYRTLCFLTTYPQHRYIKCANMVSSLDATMECQVPHSPTQGQPVLYTVFSSQHRTWMIFVVAFAGWFSTLSSFIYFPAISTLARGLHTSVQTINLTVTAYLVVAGIAPSIVGNFADSIGRRPIFLITLSLYVISNVGLALQRSFTALLLLRMVQSAGISGILHESLWSAGDLGCFFATVP